MARQVTQPQQEQDLLTSSLGTIGSLVGSIWGPVGGAVGGAAGGAVAGNEQQQANLNQPKAVPETNAFDRRKAIRQQEDPLSDINSGRQALARLDPETQATLAPVFDQAEERLRRQQQGLA